ncbi:MAG: DUF4440 domain-containing protein [Gracilimonas sp.]
MTDQNIKNTINKCNELFESTYKRGDSAGMAELYTDEGAIFPPNADAVHGKKAIKEFWQAIMDMGIKEIKLHTGEVEQHGDITNEVSTGTMLGENGEVLDEAKYIVIWKRENGSWKLHRDIFNSNRPAQ